MALLDLFKNKDDAQIKDRQKLQKQQIEDQIKEEERVKQKLLKQKELLKKQKILGDIVHKVDYQMKQLILFHNEALYFLPFNMRQPAMRIEMNNLPKDAVEFIINNIVLKNTLKVRKPYISKVDKNLVRRFPLMNYILMYMLSIYKNPKDLFDNIAVFSYSNRKILDLSIQNKINLLMVNLK